MNPGSKTKQEKRDWAILVYIAGDNNLSDFGLRDIAELCTEGASDKVHVGVEIDTYGEHTGSIRYEITKQDWTGEGHRTVIERLPEKDSGDPRTLLNFLEWGKSRYLADNYLVVVWNHGSGFRNVRRDIGYDDFGSSLNMPEIQEVLKRSQFEGKNKVAILGFDACLMSMVEIAYQFKDQVRIVVGSQQTEPGDGWPYERVLAAAKAADSRESLAKAIVKQYIEDYKLKGVTNITQSAVDCGRTGEAVMALSELGDCLSSKVDTSADQLRQMRTQMQSFEMADYVDLIHLCQLVSQSFNDVEITRCADKLADASRSCILSSLVEGTEVGNGHGLSVWFPATRMLYLNYRAKYLAMDCAREYGGWVKFLDAYHS